MISTVKSGVTRTWLADLFICPSVLSAKSLTKCFLSILTPLSIERFIIAEEHSKIENETFYSDFYIETTTILFIFFTVF